MKSLAAQALTFQYKLQLDNARNTINKNNVSLGDVDKALFDMSTATIKLKLLKDIVEKNVEPQVEKNKTKNINK
tara:strand:+ start:1674 stop:1895 length:222 start_codon:yes stop_codon:yes gene_type:complete